MYWVRKRAMWGVTPVSETPWNDGFTEILGFLYESADPSNPEYTDTIFDSINYSLKQSKKSRFEMREGELFFIEESEKSYLIPLWASWDISVQEDNIRKLCIDSAEAFAYVYKKFVEKHLSHEAQSAMSDLLNRVWSWNFIENSLTNFSWERNRFKKWIRGILRKHGKIGSV